MENDHQDHWSENVGCVLVAFMIVVLILAFAGEPDMWDVLIDRVSK
jgi:hypothetical protein